MTEAVPAFFAVGSKASDGDGRKTFAARQQRFRKKACKIDNVPAVCDVGGLKLKSRGSKFLAVKLGPHRQIQRKVGVHPTLVQVDTRDAKKLLGSAAHLKKRGEVAGLNQRVTGPTARAVHSTVEARNASLGLAGE
jgi:hypothetical protein